MSDRQLWAQVLQKNVDDALGIFGTINASAYKPHLSLVDAYKEFLVKYAHKPLPKLPYDTRKARVWMEGSNFNLVCEMAGYDTEFINRSFAYVQEAITLEKKLYAHYCQTYKRA